MSRCAVGLFLTMFCLGGVHPLAQKPGAAADTGSALRIDRKFAALYRTGKAIQAATKVGVNKIRFSQLIQEFQTEVEIAKDVVQTDRDRRVLDGYEQAGNGFAVALQCCWTTEDTESGQIFSKMLAICGHEMENAHRLSRGLKPLPLPKELEVAPK